MPFSRSSHVYDFVHTKGRDYRSQAEQISKWIEERRPISRTLLDVACGTGLHLSYLRASYEVAGVDVCPAMVTIARSRNPGIFISVGDMRTFLVNKRFDVVMCLFSSITYADTTDGLNITLANFARHLNPGGLCIVEPYIPPEAWRDGVLGLRTAESEHLKVAMVDRAERSGSRVRREIAYVIATPGRVEQIYEEHVFPLFTRSEYESAFREVGFEVEFDDCGFTPGRGMYIGVLAAGGPGSSV